MSRSEAGKLGGLATFAKHGRQHMKRIGKRGADVFHARYKLQPFGQYQWAIVRRSDSVIIGYIQDWR